MGFGVLIARLRWGAADSADGANSATGLGLMLSSVGLAMIPYALWHYFTTRRWNRHYHLSCHFVFLCRTKLKPSLN